MGYDLREHQQVMLEMLREVDRICKKHQIQYTLFAGTLLGAVRHQGFIPWDDDLDIVMLRPEYERFLKIAAQEIDTRAFYLQAEFSSHWPMFFTKLRRNGTACIERYVPKDYDTHMGVYIDIFPCDNLYDQPLLRKMQFWASKLVIAKALSARGYSTDNIKKKLFILLSHLFPRKILASFVRNERGNHTKKVHTFFAASSKYSKNIYPREWFLETKKLLFEGYEFPAPRQYHEILMQLYGDYQVPTPVSERGKKVHGEIVDLSHPYTLYRDVQKNLKIKEFTRSIR